MGLFGGLTSAMNAFGGRNKGNTINGMTIAQLLKGGIGAIAAGRRSNQSLTGGASKATGNANSTVQNSVGAGAQTQAELMAQRRQAAVNSRRDIPKPDPIIPILPPPPNPDNIMNNDNKFANQKMQAVGANLWQGKEMMAQKDAMKQVRSTPVPPPGQNEQGEYGEMFPSALMNKVSDKEKKRQSDIINKDIVKSPRQKRLEKEEQEKEKSKKQSYKPSFDAIDTFAQEDDNTPDTDYTEVISQIGEGDPRSPASLVDPKSKYRRVSVQDLEDKGKIKTNKKGNYVVNKEKTETSRDTLYLPKNIWKSSQGLIDESDYDEISNKVNKT